MKGARFFSLCGLSVLLLCLPLRLGAAVSNEELIQRLDDLSRVIQKQQEEIERLKKNLEQQKEGTQKSEEKTREEIKQVVKEETDKKEQTWKSMLPEWTKRIKIAGDIRLRYEGLFDRDMLQKDLSTTDLPDRSRGRIRARLFVDGTVTDEIMARFMLVTNMDTNQDATTSNTTFGNDFNDKGFWLGRAYVTYKPKWLSGLELGAGKFRNPFLHTDIMWDVDVNPEGVYELYKYKGPGGFEPFIQMGQMVVNEKDFESDAMLYISQAGFDWKIGPIQWTLGGSYYSWSNMNNSKWISTAQYRGTGGNTYVLNKSGTLQLAYDYKLVEGISSVKFKAWSVPVLVEVNYVVNTADGVPSDENSAYYAALSLGSEKEKGDWFFYYKYAAIRRNALVGSLNDQDFYGANRRGHKVAVHYLPWTPVTLRLCFFYTDPVSQWDPASPTFGKPYYDQYRMHEDRLQADVIVRF